MYRPFKTNDELSALANRSYRPEKEKARDLAYRAVA